MSRRIDVEQQWAATFKTTDSTGGQRTRREARLVIDFAAHLRGLGHDVGATEHHIGDTVLRTDLVDYTTATIWEAKSDVSRTLFRTAIGQLLDYRRLAPAGTTIGILLPRQPNPDLITLADSIPTSVAWRTEGEPPFITIPTPPRQTSP